MKIKKFIVKYGKWFDGEFFQKEKMFDSISEVMDYITSMDDVYKFTISLIKDGK